MTVIEKHNKLDLTAALREEIEILAKYPGIDRENFDVETFDPLSGLHCFLGQAFRGVDSYERRKGYRREIGTVPVDNSKVFRSEGYKMTPLEVWSAEQWKAGNKEEVLKVFRYIKEGIPQVQMS